MAQNVNPTFVKTPNRGLAQISTGSATGTVTLYTGGVNGSKIVGINGANNSTAVGNYGLILINNSIQYFVAVTSMSAGAGETVGIPGVSFLNTALTPGLPIDSDGNPYLTLASTADSLVVFTFTTIPTAGGSATFIAIGGDF